MTSLADFRALIEAAHSDLDTAALGYSAFILSATAKIDDAQAKASREHLLSMPKRRERATTHPFSQTNSHSRRPSA
jgi:hypothetical protein